MAKITLMSFIDGPRSPLRDLLRLRIVSSTLLQNISDETLSKTEQIIQTAYNDDYLHIDMNQFILSGILFAIATYHNYNVVYNKKLYLASFTQNVKLFVMIIFFIFAKNIDEVQ